MRMKYEENECSDADLNDAVAVCGLLVISNCQFIVVMLIGLCQIFMDGYHGRRSYLCKMYDSSITVSNEYCAFYLAESN